MITINLRGTSGSGKSTIVREVMKRYRFISARFIEGRRQPIGYACWMSDLKPYGDGALYVPGHYETACGGCDTITKVDDAYTQVIANLPTSNVLYEGIMVQDDVKRAVELSKSTPLLVIALTTPIEVCVASIQSRRDARGDDRPLDPKNTISRAGRVKKNIQRLRAGGVECLELSREEALAEVLRRLGL